MNWQSIESLIKNRLLGGEIHGETDDIWAAIEKELPVKKKKKRFVFFLIPFGLFGAFLLYSNVNSSLGNGGFDNVAHLNNDKEEYAQIASSMKDESVLSAEYAPLDVILDKEEEKIVEKPRYKSNKSSVMGMRNSDTVWSKNDNKNSLVSASNSLNESSLSVSESFDDNEIIGIPSKLLGQSKLLMELANERVTLNVSQIEAFDPIGTNWSLLDIEDKKIKGKNSSTGWDILSGGLYATSIMVYGAGGINLGKLKGKAVEFKGESKIKSLESYKFGVKLTKSIGRSNLLLSVGMERQTSVWYVKATQLKSETEILPQIFAFRARSPVEGQPPSGETTNVEETSIEQKTKKVHSTFSNYTSYSVPIQLSYVKTRGIFDYFVSGGANVILRDDFIGYKQDLDILGNTAESISRVALTKSDYRIQPFINVGLAYNASADLSVLLSLDYQKSLEQVRFYEIDLAIEPESLTIGIGLVKKW